MSSLDNPVGSSLTGPHEHLAEVLGGARRYAPDVAPFSALLTTDGWEDLARLVGPGNAAVLFQPGITPPPEWEVQARMPIRQMVASDPIDPPAEGSSPLADEDVTDMLALVAETGPGPFHRRTIELGGYLGIREDGHLVAMAGERMRPDGYGEISAVCTRAIHRGRGLASTLVRGVAAAIQARGDTPMLHVLGTNVGAIHVYERLGFEVRTTFDVLRLLAPSR